MKSILILDDDKGRMQAFGDRLCRTNTTVVWAKTARSMIEYLDKAHWDHIFLDHDLGLSGPGAGSGTEVVNHILYLRNHGRFQRTKFWVHSMNHERAHWMYSMLRSAGLQVRDAPEAWEHVELARKAG